MKRYSWQSMPSAGLDCISSYRAPNCVSKHSCLLQLISIWRRVILFISLLILYFCCLSYGASVWSINTGSRTVRLKDNSHLWQHWSCLAAQPVCSSNRYSWLSRTSKNLWSCKVRVKLKWLTDLWARTREAGKESNLLRKHTIWRAYLMMLQILACLYRSYSTRHW